MGPTFQRGEMLLIVLWLLDARPMSAAEMGDEFAAVAGSKYRWASSAVLTALEALEFERLLEITSSGDYSLTAEGAAALARRARAGILESLTPSRQPALASQARTSPVLEQVAVVFTDLVGSTSLLDRLGEDAAHKLRRRHFGLLRQAIRDHGGNEVKSLGDGLMVTFECARAAVDCGVAMQRAVAADEDELDLRIGIACGETLCEEGDYFGRPVILARRLCDAAETGGLVVSQQVSDVVAGVHSVKSLGPFALKGLSEPVAASAIQPRPLALGV